MRLRCPQCREFFESEQSEAMPFCSKRCRLIDLGGWLSEERSVPHEPDPDDYDFDEEPPDPSWN